MTVAIMDIKRLGLAFGNIGRYTVYANNGIVVVYQPATTSFTDA